MKTLDRWLYEAPSALLPTPCKRFSGAKVRGHGSLRLGGQHWYAHRYAWFLAHGAVPKQLNHKCEHSDCCALDHLYDGSQKQNVHDKIKAWVNQSSPLYFRCGHDKFPSNRYTVRISSLTELPVFACVTCKRNRRRH